MTCAICKTRKPRRNCPGIQADICSVCCATEREETIDCPLECAYLHDAHLHEKLPAVEAAQMPNQNVEITEEFLQDNEILLAFLAVTLLEGAMDATGATDWDMREALAALIATARTLQSGIYYETTPDNRFAASITRYVREKVAALKKDAEAAGGAGSVRDTDILKVLVFLQRLEFSNNNGRKKSRAFIDFLRGFYVPADTDSVVSSLSEPDDPMVIL